MPKTEIAPPFDASALRPGATAERIFVRQYLFPHEFDPGETVFECDGEALMRLPEWEHAKRVFLRPRDGTAPDFLTFFREHPPQVAVLPFLKAVTFPLHQEQPAWTGFRVLASNGPGLSQPIFHLQLFARSIAARTAVFSTEFAPNVVAPPPASSTNSSPLYAMLGVDRRVR